MKHARNVPINNPTPAIHRVFDWSFAPFSGGFDLKWGLLGCAFDFCVFWPNAGQWCKLFMGHGFYIHCFVGAFESLWRSLLKLGFLGWTINFIKINKPLKDSFARLKLRSIGKSGFRFWNLDLGFCNESWNGFHLREICPRGQFQLRNPNPNFMDFFLLFDWEIWKRIYKTVLFNSGLLFANFACTYKTAVLKDSFSYPFADFSFEQ